jgi:hypothetical protein
VGQTLKIPALVRYPLRSGESLATLARRFYGGPDLALELAELNRPLDPRRLAVGTPVRVALLAVAHPPAGAPAAQDAADPSSPAASPPAPPAPPAPAASAARSPERLPATAVPVPPAAAAPPPGDSPPALPARAGPPSAALHARGDAPGAPVDVAAARAGSLEAPLREAVNRYLDGDYAEARAQLESLRAPVLAQGSRAQRGVLLRHLLYTYVAFDQAAAACSAHGALRDLEPELRWDPDATSPKILRAIDTCP